MLIDHLVVTNAERVDVVDVVSDAVIPSPDDVRRLKHARAVSGQDALAGGGNRVAIGIVGIVKRKENIRPLL